MENLREIISILCFVGVIILVAVVPPNTTCYYFGFSAGTNYLVDCQVVIYQVVGLLVIMFILANFLPDNWADLFR